MCHILGRGDSMNIREIITKTILAKGKKTSKNKYIFTISGISKVLGCWVTNHSYQAVYNQGQPKVEGTYDVHIWYSCDDENDSSLYKTQIAYAEEIDVNSTHDLDFSSDDRIEAIAEDMPKCIQADTEKDLVTIEITKEIAVRIVGDACLRVEVKEEEDDEIRNPVIESKKELDEVIWDGLDDDWDINDDFLKS